MHQRERKRERVVERGGFVRNSGNAWAPTEEGMTEDTSKGDSDEDLCFEWQTNDSWRLVKSIIRVVFLKLRVSPINKYTPDISFFLFKSKVNFPLK